MSNHIFTSLLEALEKEYGAVTQAKLARELKVTQPTISNWKNGGVNHPGFRGGQLV